MSSYNTPDYPQQYSDAPRKRSRWAWYAIGGAVLWLGVKVILALHRGGIFR